MHLQTYGVRRAVSLSGVMLLGSLLAGCDRGVAQNEPPPPPEVSVAQVVQQKVSQWDSFNGRIEAVESVQLRPRVSGYIDKVNYHRRPGGEKGRGAVHD